MIAVKFNGAEACCRELREQKSQLDAYRNNLIRIRRRLPLAIRVSSNVEENLGNLVDRLGKISDRYNKLTGGLEEALSLYRRTENELLGRTESAEASEQTGAQTDGGPSFNWFKLFKGAGILGGITSTIADIVSGDGPWYLDVLKGGKQMLGTVKDVAEVVAGETRWWEALLGLGNKAKDIPSDGNLLSELFGKELGKYASDGSVTKNLGAIAKWGSVVVTGITAGISNYQEYNNGDITAERAVEETVMETAVDVGLDLALTVGITAALTAAVGAAPAVLVAGGVYLTKLGLDALSEHFFQKDVTELVSDFVLDVGEWIADKGDDLVHAVSGFAQDTVEWVSDGIGRARDALADTGRWIGARWRTIFA